MLSGLMRRILLALLLTAACSSSTPPVPVADATPAEVRCKPGENLQMCGKNLVIAHRGGAKLWPEETLLALENATKLGVDVLEIDVNGTKDGKIVCIHNDTVDATTDGSGPVKEKTLAELQALDAGAKFTTDGGKTFPFKGMGVKLATLEEALRAHPNMPYSVEIKQTNPPIVDEVIAVIDATGMSGKVVIASFDDDTIRAVRAKRPTWATSFAGGEIVKFAQLQEEDADSYVPPSKLIQAPLALATEAKLRIARKHGIKMHVWTIDDRSDMESLWKLGVEGIMSDDPVLLHQVTKDLGRTDKGL